MQSTQDGMCSLLRTLPGFAASFIGGCNLVLIYVPYIRFLCSVLCYVATKASKQGVAQV